MLSGPSLSKLIPFPTVRRFCRWNILPRLLLLVIESLTFDFNFEILLIEDSPESELSSLIDSPSAESKESNESDLSSESSEDSSETLDSNLPAAEAAMETLSLSTMVTCFLNLAPSIPGALRTDLGLPMLLIEALTL